MKKSKIDINILGKLILLQSSLQVAPDEIVLGEQVCHMFSEIPGIQSSALYIDDYFVVAAQAKPFGLDEWPSLLQDALQELNDSSTEGLRNFQQLSIQTTKTTYGKFLLILTDNDAFATYKPFIENTVNLIALLLENWRNEQELENKVEERTNDLLQSTQQLENEIVERKRIETKLRQSHKMEAIGTLAGGIAHDFNNILAAIMGFTEMAIDDLPSYSPAKHHLEEVIKASHRAKDLVKQILSFSRKDEEERIPVNLHVLVKEALLLLRATIPTTIDIRPKIDANAGQILADPTQIHQIVMNICTNGAQAMEKTGGVLDVRLDRYTTDERSLPHSLPSGTYLRLTIRDNGPGIPDELKERIFDPYFTTKEYGQGSGMGLAVVSGIIRNHEGFIEMQSGPDKGATFTIFFPRVEQQEFAVNETLGTLPTGNGERILVVDDDPTIADMTARRVELLGYDAVARTSSLEALELFQTHPESYDLIITDQTMPELTGKQLVKKVKAIRQKIPVIICSGFSAQMNATIASELGIDSYLPKPIDKVELARSIRNLLDEKVA